MLRNRSKVVRARLEIYFVSRPGKIANRQLQLGIGLVEHRFKESKLPPTIEQRISHQGNAIVFFQLQRQRCLNGLPTLRSWSGLGINTVFFQFRILRRSLFAGLFILGVTLL